MRGDFTGIDRVPLSESIQISRFRGNDKEGSHPLQTFLLNHALYNQKKKLSITWIVVQKSEPLLPLGYFSLACASIDIDDLNNQEKKGCPTYDRFPALLIGKFAIDDRYQNHGLGTLLMDHVYAFAKNYPE